MRATRPCGGWYKAHEEPKVEFRKPEAAIALLKAAGKSVYAWVDSYRNRVATFVDVLKCRGRSDQGAHGQYRIAKRDLLERCIAS